MFEVDNSIIDAAELLDRVRTRVLNKNINIQEYNKNQENKRVESFSGDLGEIKRWINSAKRNCSIMDSIWYYGETPIESTNIIKVFFKRCIRKSTYWILKPFWQKQSEFNGAVTRTIEDMLKIQVELIEKIEGK